jgi:hypothetical protein
MPAAIFGQLRDPSRKNPHPVLITAGVSTTSSRQIKDYILCNDCEQRFSEQGESWVLANMARPAGFALQDALMKAGPISVSDGFALFAGAAIPAINMNALVYFAMSVFWRAAVHQWRNIDGDTTPIKLGQHEDEIRLFLMGGSFPADVAITVSVWPKREVLPVAYTPRQGEAPGFEVFNFMIPGIEFRLYLGPLPAELYALCAHGSRERFIISSASLEEETKQTFFSLMKTSKPSRGLAGN